MLKKKPAQSKYIPDALIYSNQVQLTSTCGRAPEPPATRATISNSPLLIRSRCITYQLVDARKVLKVLALAVGLTRCVAFDPLPARLVFLPQPSAARVGLLLQALLDRAPLLRHCFKVRPEEKKFIVIYCGWRVPPESCKRHLFSFRSGHKEAVAARRASVVAVPQSQGL
jgi:hypothetical protein